MYLCNQIDIHDRDGVHVPWNEQTSVEPQVDSESESPRASRAYTPGKTAPGDIYIHMFLSAEIDG